MSIVKMIPQTFGLVSAVFCLLLLTSTAYSQTPSPITYLFVEVKDTSGKAIDDATVTLDTRIASKTDKDGVAKESFLQSSGQRRYDLQVSKAGYLTSEHVIFAYCSRDRSIYISESLPGSTEDLQNCKSTPTSVTLLRTPVTAAERQAIEAEERRRQFMLSVKKGQAATLSKLLEAGIKPDTTDNKGMPAIAWAAFAGDADTIKILLDAGAVVRNKDTLAHHALLIYLTYGISNDRHFDEAQAVVQQREEVVRRLVQAGAGLNVQGSYRRTVLNNAIDLSPYGPQTYLASASYYLLVDSIKLLIAAGADVNAPDVGGHTPLMSAANKMSASLVKLLLDAGARVSINAKDHQGRTALMLAAERGHVETIKMLLEAGAAINAKDNFGRTAFMHTQGYMYGPSSSLDAGKFLIAAGASITDVNARRQTPLMLAASRNYLEEVKLLLAAGARASINARDEEGKTALMFVQGQLHDDASADIIRTLVAAGADVNAIDDEGRTPLMLSLSQNFNRGNPQVLLSEGARASLNNKDKQGRTALMFAARSGDVRTTQMFLDAGAFLNARDNKNQTALSYAVLGYPGRPDIIKLLAAAGLGVADVNTDGQTPLMLAAEIVSPEAVQELLDAGAGPSVNKKDKVGKAALMYAVSGGAYRVTEVVTSLMRAGANVNEADESGQTVLMWALRGHSPAMIKNLLESGARVNAQDKQGLTALMHATICRECGTKSEMAEEVRVLLEGGADVRIKDNQGRTALMLAKQSDSNSLIDLLEEAERRQ